MKSEDQTLLLRRSDVEQFLSLSECIDAVEEVFRLQGEGKVPPAGILGVKVTGGGLHVKIGILPGRRNYIVAKLNTNFPANRQKIGLPTIQGLIVLCDAENGRPLAVLDSIDITIKRTAAASAVAAKYLARSNATVATVCGCGQQGRAQLRALRNVLPLARIYAFDLNPETATKFAVELGNDLKLEIEPIQDLPRAIRESQVCITEGRCHTRHVHCRSRSGRHS
jgi:alanine dehydrogenase